MNGKGWPHTQTIEIVTDTPRDLTRDHLIIDGDCGATEGTRKIGIECAALTNKKAGISRIPACCIASGRDAYAATAFFLIILLFWRAAVFR